MPLADFQQLCNDLVRDKDGVIALDERDRQITNAVLRYSEDKPRPVVVDLVGEGSQQLTLPMGWQMGFSQLQQLEHPLDRYPRSFIDMSLVALYQTPTGIVIDLPVNLSAADTARLTYTQRHLVEAVEDTVPIEHRHAVCCLAAAVLCGQLANHYATDSEPTIQADAMDHRRKSDVYRARERELRQQYFKALGLDEQRGGAAGTVVNLQSNDSRGGDRLFHQRRYR